MGSFPGSCEIVEAGEEVNSVQNSRRTYRPSSGSSVMDKDQKPRVLKLAYNESLEDDINQLFEAISLKNSTKGWGLSHEVGTSMSPVRKSDLKKPISVPHSPRLGTSQPVSLKQALRELSITKASEMAAMKRISKSTSSSVMSEAGRIKNLYNTKVVEPASGSGLLMDEGKGNMVEISLVPEESQLTSSQKMPPSLQVPKMKLINQSDNSSPQFTIPTLQNAMGISQSANSSPLFAVPKRQNFSGTSKSAHSSPQYAIPKMKNAAGTNQSVHYAPQFSVPTIQNAAVTNQSAHSSPRFASSTIQNSTGTNKGAQSSSRLTVPTTDGSTGTNQRAHSSPRLAVPTQSGPQTARMQDEIISTSTNVGTHAVKVEIAQKEKHVPAHPSSSDTVDLPEQEKNVSAPSKLANRTSTVKSGRKGRLHAVPSSSSSNGSRVTKISRNSPRVAKQVLRKKGAVKKKVKQDSASSPCSSNFYSEVRSQLEPSSTQLICQRCHCALKNASNLPYQDSTVSNLTSVSAEVISTSVNTGIIEPDFIPNDSDRSQPIVGKTKSKGEFSQSSKSSLGDYSSSTSNSDDSNLSGSSCGNRPHMSADVRWEAIRHVRLQYGSIGLRHFNLLQKLGCGDIGTVYLAELIGTNCLFAIKVMDNEFLARRKKMPRAQTEREILRMLDHPFLPTLYSQFTSDNLSCLVMEYCPGGDLHVLRQKQLGRCFSEPAARFYVAEVLLALEYLHMLGVIYRDLKPENILVREDGHIMLTDFDLSLRCSVSPTLLKSSSNMDPARVSGPCTESNCIQPFCIEPTCQVPCFSPRFLPATAKTRKPKADPAAQIRSLPQLVAEPTDARSNSFVGTHEYLAPEIIKGEGHGAAVDWWTFGIFLYELLYGRTPFKGSGNEETLANVVMQSLKFPDSPLISFQARDLIRGLLIKEPENRLGSQKGAAEIKQHPFFEGLNWALIRCAIPPELPDFYDYGIQDMVPQKSKYLECKATGEQLEFELF